jgi:hypothetical protein
MTTDIMSIQHILVTDTKSVRTTSMTRKKYVGYDGSKKFKGLKLSLLCNTLVISNTVEQLQQILLKNLF